MRNAELNCKSSRESLKFKENGITNAECGIELQKLKEKSEARGKRFS